jgi:hypothetical protein
MIILFKSKIREMLHNLQDLNYALLLIGTIGFKDSIFMVKFDLNNIHPSIPVSRNSYLPFKFPTLMWALNIFTKVLYRL